MSWDNLKRRILYPLMQRLFALAQSILGELQPEELNGLDRQVESDNIPKNHHSRSNSRDEKDEEQQRVDGPPAHWVERVRKAAPELLRSPEPGRINPRRELYQPETSKEPLHQVPSSEVTGEPSSTKDDEGSELIHQSANAYMSMARPSTRPSGSKTEETREFDKNTHNNTESVYEVFIPPDNQDIPDIPGHVANVQDVAHNESQDNTESEFGMSVSPGEQVAQEDRHHSANIQDVVRNKAGPSGEETPESSIESHDNVELVYEMPASTGDEDASGASGHVSNIVDKQTLRTTPEAIPKQEEPIPSMTDSGKAPQPDAFFPALNLPNTQTRLPTSDLSQLPDYDIPTRYSTAFDMSPLQNSAEDSQVPMEGVWPELPEAPSSSTSDEVAMALSELERLRRLDREQRGILWRE